MDGQGETAVSDRDRQLERIGRAQEDASSMFGVDLLAIVKALEVYAASVAELVDLPTDQYEIAMAGIFGRTLGELDRRSVTFASVMLLCKDFLEPIVLPHQ